MSAPSKHGGPAFPVAFRWNAKQVILEDGISVRDYFAGQALAGMCANGVSVSASNHAEWAYECADAMLAARERMEEAK